MAMQRDCDEFDNRSLWADKTLTAFPMKVQMKMQMRQI
jgi:hypothetical protein